VERVSAPERTGEIGAGDERFQLEPWLTFYRETLLLKCDGLDLEQMKVRPITTSKLSLLGIIRHITFVEQIWFERYFTGADVTPYYKSAPGSDNDFDNLDEFTLDETLANYETAIATSVRCAEGHALDELTPKPWRDREIDLRWIYLHMIEEYARHCGHADILRELIDGQTGY
jgi:uncharacterized damage-inducible protein DinB